MGFTIGDLLISGADKYRMKLVAGKNGWANSIRWLLMAEDTIIMRNFKGKELVVTTGLGFDTTDKLLELIEMLDKHHASGLIVNTGFYIHEIPEVVLKKADACDLPVITVPWDVEMSEMIKDLTVRIFMSSKIDEQISAALIRAIEKPEAVSEYRETLSSVFDVDGEFQTVAITTKNLDSMDSSDRSRIGYRLQIYLENISHNSHFFYYDGCFILVMSEVDQEQRKEIVEGFLERAKRRMQSQQIYVGVGTLVYDAANFHVSYERAVFAARTAMKENTPRVLFDDLGVKKFLYSISDDLLPSEVRDRILAPVLEYDEKHQAELLPTLRAYLKCGGSINQVADELFIHKNTILYRMQKIRKLLSCELTTPEERIYYYLAILLLEQSQE